MKIFISWSGDASHAVAQILRTWLPSVLQHVEPYLSSEDIPPGARWSQDIARRLEETSFGIICVTSDNVRSPWLNFEAGAISKSVDWGRVTPFLFEISPAELIGPLAQFQATRPQIEDVKRLLKLINSLSGRPISEGQLSDTIRVWWPRLADRLQALRKQEAQRGPRPGRDLREIVEEILQISRGIQRQSIIDRASEWITAAATGDKGIEVALVDDFVLVRDGRDKTGPAMIYTKDEWHAFIRGVQNGEFDLPMSTAGSANLPNDPRPASPPDEGDSATDRATRTQP